MQRKANETDSVAPSEASEACNDINVSAQNENVKATAKKKKKKKERTQLRLTNHLIADGFDRNGVPLCDYLRSHEPPPPVPYEHAPYPGPWMEPLEPNPAVQALLDPHRALLHHPALEPREVGWADKRHGVGLAEQAACAQLEAELNQITPGGKRWAHRGIDAMFAPTVEEGYNQRYMSIWAQHKSAQVDRELAEMGARQHVYNNNGRLSLLS